MKADPERTRDLLRRHRATAEGIVNNLRSAVIDRLPSLEGVIAFVLGGIASLERQDCSQQAALKIGNR